MTNVEQIIAKRLSVCRLHTDHKHFVNDLAYYAKFDQNVEFTHHDRKHLGRLYWEYRTQLGIKGFPVCDKFLHPLLERELHSGLTHFAITRIAKTQTASSKLVFEANYSADVSHRLVIEEIEYYFCLAANVPVISETQMRREYQQGIEDRNVEQLRLAV